MIKGKLWHTVLLSQNYFSFLLIFYRQTNFYKLFEWYKEKDFKWTSGRKGGFV